MSAADATAAPDSISLALAFHQAPGHFPELLRGVAPLPSDMTRLLRLAGGVSDAETKMQTALSATTIQLAARFFIEQVLLARGADHYRVLGVNADASIEQIKEHHRLLMRVFHPDRGEATVFVDSIAARINLAYNSLRLPADRAAYDARRRDAAAVAQAARMVPRHRVQQSLPRQARNLPPWLTRNLPQLVLASAAMLATAAVSWVYFNQEPTAALGGTGSSKFEYASYPSAKMPLPKGEPLASLVTPAKVPIQSDVARPIEEEPVAVKGHSMSPAPPPEDRPSASAVANVSTKMSTSINVQRTAETAQAPSAVVVQTAVSAAQALAPPASAPGSATAGVTQGPQAATVAPAPITAPITSAQSETQVSLTPAASTRRGVTLDDLVKLVAQFSSEYERGDLDRFLSLFDEGARVEGGGKERIRNDYGDLFRTTQTRQLVIWDMKWAPDGEHYRGEGYYRAKVLRQGEENSRIYSGRIRIDAIAGPGGTPRVKGLFH